MSPSLSTGGPGLNYIEERPTGGVTTSGSPSPHHWFTYSRPWWKGLPDMILTISPHSKESPEAQRGRGSSKVTQSYSGKSGLYFQNSSLVFLSNKAEPLCLLPLNAQGHSQ